MHYLSWTLPPTHLLSLMSPSHLTSMLSSFFPPFHNLLFLAFLYSHSFCHHWMLLLLKPFQFWIDNVPRSFSCLQLQCQQPQAFHLSLTFFAIHHSFIPHIVSIVSS